MDMSPELCEKHILDWDETDVHQWFSNLGFPQYEREIREHKIQGDSLCLLDSEGLKSLGITTVGQRLSILKSIYHLKVAHEIPLNEDDYMPPSEVLAPAENVSIEGIHSTVKDQATRLRTLEEGNRTLTLAMRSFSDEIIKLRSSMGLPYESSNQIRKRLPYLRSEVQSADRSPATSTKAQSLATPPTTQESVDSANGTKVTLDDPTWKVLPAALRKHRILPEEWQNYAMFISYGPTSNRVKRRLDLDEKPIYLFKKLKEANKNPAFVLKNMKDMHSTLDLDDDDYRQSSSTSQETTTRVQNSIYPSPPLSRTSPGF